MIHKICEDPSWVYGCNTQQSNFFEGEEGVLLTYLLGKLK